jgi:ubiquinone/menaquinone biosynthesis C-methylase UbiE
MFPVRCFVLTIQVGGKIMDVANKFHALQKNFFNDDLHKDERKKFHESWFNEETVDFWRHQRMYETLRPLAEYYRDKSWVSIGDGRYGLDSVRMEKLFGTKVFPTDISEEMLKKGHEIGLIKNFSIENAENLSFKDDSFDFVFCKEALHHCPRPTIALYEMIRVARIGVVIIEPLDDVTLSRPEKLMKQTLKFALNTLFPSNHTLSKEYDIFNAHSCHSFEDSGNYVYAISMKELEKIAHGLNLGGLAYKGFNDYYIKGCEFEKAVPENETFRKVFKIIEPRNAKCNKYPFLYAYNMVSAIIFKHTINDTVKNNMITSGFIFPKKEINLYL